MTQARIITNVSEKADSFFEEAPYRWESTQAPSSKEPSAYLVDLTDFLSTVMMSVLIQLPEFSKNHVYRGALAYCAMVLMVSSPLLFRPSLLTGHHSSPTSSTPILLE